MNPEPLSILRVYKDKDGIEYYQLYRGCKTTR
jgi:hypothetical protein